jgi:hypothetical protein
MVTPSRGREDVDIDDWTMPEGLAATLVEQDLFAKYPADLNPPPATRSPDFATAPVGADIERIQRAVTRGPFYAGRVAVARWPCGDVCEHWALVDTARGRIVSLADTALQPLRSEFPCKKAEALEFSEASRLLRVHRLDGGRVLTRDFVWSYEMTRLDAAGESAQSVEVLPGGGATMMGPDMKLLLLVSLCAASAMADTPPVPKIFKGTQGRRPVPGGLPEAAGSRARRRR